MEFPRKISFHGNIANHVRNPYKTWRFLIPFGSFPRNMPQEAWKTIRITVFSWGVSTISENLVFLEENQLSEEEEKHTRNPYKPCRLSIPFCTFPRKGAHEAWKTISNTVYFEAFPQYQKNLYSLRKTSLEGGMLGQVGDPSKSEFQLLFISCTHRGKAVMKGEILSEWKKIFSDRLFHELITSCTSEKYYW